MKHLGNKIVLLAVMMTFSITLPAQKYAVHFTDKNNSPYSVENPGEFLSERSVARRLRHNVETTIQDLPVNPSYITAVANLGADVAFTSRWLNCALVSCTSTVAAQIGQLSFVSDVVYVSTGSYKGKSTPDGFISQYADKLEREENFTPIVREKGNFANTASEVFNYGSGYTQINQIGGIPVHEQGFTGEGVLVAIIDGGFNNANNIGGFAPLYNENRVLFELDVVNPGGNVYGSNTSDHGTNVLSCMASSLEGQFVGTAPDASFALIRTENGDSEYLIECYNWVVGAEAADSIGADIINSSLGYNTFDDASMNYTFSQMDGETAVSSIGAKTAIEKGIFVTLSAGNSNGTSWPKVGTPADTKDASTVAAINSDGGIAYFSSLGPNAANDPKPDVCALGVSATVLSTSGNVTTASGTSFSSPIACGMYACLIQANPYVAPLQLRDFVNETCDRFPNHYNDYGYGIPDFSTALSMILMIGDIEVVDYEINDPQGNNNGLLNAGETVSVDLTVHNKANTQLQNVSTTFATTNEYVTLIDNVADLGDFAADETKTISDAFSFSLSENAPANAPVNFNATTTYGDETCISTISIDVYGTLLTFSSLAVSDLSGNANGLLDPGETANLIVSVINNGNVGAIGVTGVLSCTSEDVTINTNNQSYGNVAIGATSDASYNVALSSSAVPGGINLPFVLVLTDADGQTTEIEFSYDDKCDMYFYLHDSYGDGWNGASIIVSFDDGTPTEVVTLQSGSSSTEIVEVSVNTNVTFSWTAGSWDNECSFEVEYEDGTEIYHAATAPSAGVFHEFLNLCGTTLPPEPPLWAPQYAVHFKDKDNSPYSVNVPSEYLSPRALERREKFNVDVTEDDLPVNPSYVAAVKATGAYVKWTSRWSNCAIVYAENEMIDAISDLDCVEKVVLVKPAEGKYSLPEKTKWDNETLAVADESGEKDFEYGLGYGQIEQLNGIYVHEKGYTGDGILIGVLDAGYENADGIDALAPLFESGRIVMTKNIAEQSGSIFENGISSHGTSVLSLMGANLAGQLVGTAPDATYALFRTEDARTEYLIEEYNWMIGAEMADSLGVDIINSSLSYNTFDDPSMDHTYEQMDGNTAISSIAAKMLIERGVYAAISAGNSNGTEWPWVGTPADVVEAMTVGAVDVNGVIAGFSSIGPNGAGNIKPNLCACGSSAYVARPDNTITSGSGTSFSSPISCGMVACMIQANNIIAPSDLLAIIESKCDRYPEHFIDYGYGIPDFGAVLDDFLSICRYDVSSSLNIFPNPANDILFVNEDTKLIKNIIVSDLLGRKIMDVAANANTAQINVSDLNPGIHFITVTLDDNTTTTKKFVKE